MFSFVRRIDWIVKFVCRFRIYLDVQYVQINKANWSSSCGVNTAIFRRTMYMLQLNNLSGDVVM